MEKGEKLSFQKINLTVFDGTFRDFFSEKFRKMMIGIGLLLFPSHGIHVRYLPRFQK